MTTYNIPETMKAWQGVEANAPYSLRTVPVPKPTGHDALVKICVASHCHTDTLVQSGLTPTKLPCTGSHEGAGIVVAIGSSVTTLTPGDRVMVGLSYHACGSCDECVSSTEQYCLEKFAQGGGGMGLTRDGCFAEYVLVDSRTSLVIPDGVSFETAAPLACGGLTAFKGMLLAQKHAQLKTGDWVGIVGAGGGVGHFAVQFARASGWRVVCVDARDVGLAVAREMLGDDEDSGLIIDAREADAVERVRKQTKGGVKAVINVSGAESAVTMSCAMTQNHGSVIQIGQPLNVSVPSSELIFRDVRILGSLAGSEAESKQMLEFVAQNNITAQIKLFEGLDSVAEMLEHIKSGNIRAKAAVVVDRALI